ncbi:hypothetical protein AAZX31_01G218300 [Glycine max]|uniref:F-box domain-containing protein n=3 Tax=Glycine subgen. Soja TaxID=1462606 RepID=K7K5F6_SOYBN|nr:F-box/kelch-repeat protein At3g06240 [Glycine max]XP_028216769.1 F-box/kelch-repeat protein At3g06240-like [Glycine soja]KAH1164347.1 hypothetical protein GYH30_002408 [Glycine max]KAH1267722.1 F-box/kelch-repeat protein [Glycine max]KRH77763.1 hypothetical protein GLYMA_01G232700v4 [Glycine max]RZC31504.1 F-box/kelch-repeat protein [Glycine soja]|eukprot:XP_006574314.1 F-box/kelch-repeat protein At3g06240 [Glycine max]
MKDMNSTLPRTLPEDLITEILMMLPVRSILRFKCMCKSWFSLISDPEFARSHFALAATPTTRFFVSADDHQVKCIDIEASLHDDNSAKVVFNFPLPSPEDQYYDCQIDMVGSCRGFILLITRGDVFGFIIWNPSTGLRKGISYAMDDPTYDFDLDRFGFGYDSSTDDYVIVNLSCKWLFRTDVHCFSLRTNSWSRILRTVFYYPLLCGHGVFVNGALHWFVKPFDRRRLRAVIISFDVTERELFEIPLPLNFDLKDPIYDLTVMEGCLCLSVAQVGYGTRIWMMKEYKVQSSWTKLFVPIYNQRHPFFPVFCSICLTKKDEFLGSNHKTLVKLNKKGDLLEHRARWHYVDYCSILVRRGVYRESLLSLPE